VTAGASHFADLSRPFTLAEPRVACPCCGAHLIVALRVAERVVMACPVCEWRSAEDTGKVKLHPDDETG
jgi:hypothetical protein